MNVWVLLDMLGDKEEHEVRMKAYSSLIEPLRPVLQGYSSAHMSLMLGKSRRKDDAALFLSVTLAHSTEQSEVDALTVLIVLAALMKESSPLSSSSVDPLASIAPELVISTSLCTVILHSNDSKYERSEIYSFIADFSYGDKSSMVYKSRNMPTMLKCGSISLISRSSHFLWPSRSETIWPGD